MTNSVKVNLSEIKNKTNMTTRIITGVLCILLFGQVAYGQVTTRQIEHFSVSTSKAILSGKTKPVRELRAKPTTSKEKKKNS